MTHKYTPLNCLKTRVTPKQNEYLLHLQDGPRTTKAMAQELKTSMKAAHKIIKIIRDAGLIESSPIDGIQAPPFFHSLIRPYDELGISVTTTNGSNPIRDEEILYAAILRNGLLVGQRLKNQYRKIFPDRSDARVKNIVTTARRRGLCR